MDESMLLRGVLGSLMGGRRRKSTRALRHLTGGGLGGSLLGTVMSHPTAALTAAGLAWGVFETLQGQSSGSSGSGSSGAGFGASGSAGSVGSMGSAGSTGSPGAALPPLPELFAPPAPSGVSADVVRMVRLAVSAANADGAMNDQERQAVIAQAGDAGVVEIVEAELGQRRPLAEIVAGVTDPAQRATLYVLAFTVLRADEVIGGAERIYLAQLAHLLGLDPPTVQKLEADTAARIDGAEP